jgi:hypothetical protein
MPAGRRKYPNPKAFTLRGKTIRWELADGSGTRAVYHHTFDPDGSVVYRGATLAGRGTRIRPSRALYHRLSDAMFVVSYLNPPYTLTAFLDVATHRVSGVVSSDKMWMRFKGRWGFVPQ